MILTCLVCLAPILFGISKWHELPNTMAIHFNLYGEADGFASKTFVVFGLPVLMAFLQMISCICSDLEMRRARVSAKFERVMKWIVPMITVVLYIVTIGYGLGWDVDIRRIVFLLLGVVFLIVGNNLPECDYVKGLKGVKMEPEKARKVNRFLGKGMVFLGGLSLVCAFLPTIASVIWMVLLILYMVISISYGVKVSTE